MRCRCLAAVLLVVVGMGIIFMCENISLEPAHDNSSETADIYGIFAYAQTGKTIYTDNFGMDVDITAYFCGEQKTAVPLIVYVINHCGEHPSTESDESIISDYLAQGYAVTVLDYKSDSLSVSPYIEKSAVTICNEIKNNGRCIDGFEIDTDAVFILPSGYRVARDVVYFDMSVHSSTEALDRIVQVWNTQESVAKKVYDRFGVNFAAKTADGNGGYTYSLTDAAKADDVYDIMMADGTGMTAEDMQLKMDIIYPSVPDTEVPIVAYAATNTPRSIYALSATNTHNNGLLFKGYAVAWYDHEYLPFLNKSAGGWGHAEPAFNISDYDAVKTQTAAIRCIKYYADTYGYSNTAVGVFGLSKSSWCAVLSNPEPLKLGEVKGSDEAPEQPFLYNSRGEEISSSVVCCSHAMGTGSKSFSRYLSAENVPTLIYCGQMDTGNGCSYWEKEKIAYENSGIEYLAFDMMDLGHTYLRGYDDVYEFDRYQAFMSFFDYYLKNAAPQILYTSAVNGRLVDIKTTTAKYNSKDDTNHWQVTEGEELFVQFVGPITEQSLIRGTVVVNSRGEKLENKWHKECGGSRWVYDGQLAEGETYTLRIFDNSLSDEYGRTVSKGIVVGFKR